jgi:hypothetical protein
MVAPETGAVYVGELDRNETRRFLAADSAAYATTGHLLFVRQGTLFAQAFDPVRMTLTGNPSSVAADVVFGTLITRVSAFASVDGLVAYRSSAQNIVQNIAWFDRSGKQIKRIDAADRLRALSISPDGRRVALARELNVGTADIWLLEIGRNLVTKFTFAPANGANPNWSPDGSRIVFGSNRGGRSDLYLESTAGGMGEACCYYDCRLTDRKMWSSSAVSASRFAHRRRYRRSKPFPLR